jgi:uncharacterized protein YajQ (UPF0234 family)
MASESSFDVVSEFDHQEMVNTIDQTRREVQTRYDLKDTNTDIELSDKEITITTESDMHLTAIRDILQSKALRRNLSIKIFKVNPVIEVAGGRIKQVITLQQGLSDEVAKKIQRLIKDSKLKVQAAIQGDSVRVTGVKRDDLQAAMALLKKEITDIPLSFNNFRD